MKKTITTFLIAITLLAVIPQAFALELKISQNGTIYFYEDSVLGDEDRDEEDHDEDKRENEREDDEDDDREEKRPIRTIRPSNSSIRIETNDNKLRVDLRSNYESSKDSRTGFEKVESSKVDRLKMDFPAGQSERQQSLSERNKDELENIRETSKDHFENLREERKNRLEEMIELRNKQEEDGQQRLEFESRGITASLKGANFDYNSATGAITLTTPNGQEHELNHLPDQAIERMKKLLDSDFEKTQIEIETNEDGTVEYKAIRTKKTKLFGLISRDIDTEVVLDDETGEVTETDLPAESILGRLLDSLSF